MSAAHQTLRAWPAAARLGLSLLLLVGLGGFAASGAHLVEHHGPRDGKSGFSIDDVRGAYHGIARRAPLLEALERGHPDDLDASALPADHRQRLLAWLRSERITEDYDDLDLDPPPADVLDQSCLACHSRNAPSERRADPPLDYWDDVKPLAFTSEVAPTSTAILIASTHTHAIALAGYGMLIVLLLQLASLPRALCGTLSLAIGAGLLLDIAGMWWMRGNADLVWVVVAGGALFSGAVVLSSLLLIVDLWRR